MPKVFLLIGLMSSLAYAEIRPTPKSQCTYLDLRNSPLAEVRNQNNISWCYAFSASDLLNYYLNDPNKISAADLAISYNQTRPGKFMRWLDLNIISRNDQSVRQSVHQTGFTKITLKEAIKKGICPEEVFPSETWIKVIKTNERDVTESVPLVHAMKDIAKLHSKRKTLSIDNLPFYYSFKNIDQKIFLDILQNPTLDQLYSNLANQACQNDRQKIEIPENIKMMIRHPEMFRKISQIMDQSTIVSLDYDSRILKDQKAKGLKIGDLHTSLLVGRRWDQKTNTCEFLVRNSWGEGCSKYDSSYECEKGHIWLSEKTLYPSAISIVYIDTARK